MKLSVNWTKPLIRYAVVFGITMSLLLSGCESPHSTYTKYTDSFFDTFDTVMTVVIYSESQEEFEFYLEKIKARFRELHELYDIYNNYEGINNLKTINDSAGLEPVKVRKEILDLVLFAKEWCRLTDGTFNVAMGSVLRIWHDYRQEGLHDPSIARLPSKTELREAGKYTDIDKVIVDLENSTVFLADGKMSLDVGAVAKGYATEIVVKEMIALGLKSAMFSAGGQIRTIGKPLDGIRERWGVGIHDPKQSILQDEGLLDVIFFNDASVANSGGYQRYYVVDGKAYHHIIDPDTLMPANYYDLVTVLSADSGVADILSTALFVLPYEKGLSLIENVDEAEALWVMPNGEIKATSGMQRLMRSLGATGSKTD